MRQETVATAGPYASLHRAPESRQITTTAPHRSVFTGRMTFLPPNQQRQSSECNSLHKKSRENQLRTSC